MCLVSLPPDAGLGVSQKTPKQHSVVTFCDAMLFIIAFACPAGMHGKAMRAMGRAVGRSRGLDPS
eukprot:1035138-Alexandrium_andersonii.AAC.1